MFRNNSFDAIKVQQSRKSQCTHQTPYRSNSDKKWAVGRYRNFLNGLRPVIESLGPEGKHIVRTSKNICRNNVFDATKVQQSRKYSTIPHTNPIREQYRTKSELWNATETSWTVWDRQSTYLGELRRLSMVWRTKTVRNTLFWFFGVTRCLVETWGNLVGHFMRKVVGEKPDGDHIRDARE